MDDTVYKRSVGELNPGDTILIFPRLSNRVLRGAAVCPRPPQAWAYTPTPEAEHHAAIGPL